MTKREKKEDRRRGRRLLGKKNVEYSNTKITDKEKKKRKTRTSITKG